MRLLFRAVLAVALLAAGGAGATGGEAPDDAPPELEHTADIIPETVSTGFYARLDAGGWIAQAPRFEPVRRFGGGHAANGGGFGGGGGLKATEWLRGDVTVDYAPSAGVSSRCRGCGGRRVGADVETLTILASAYLDLPTLGAVTPYVGAGAGGAAVWADDVRVGRPPGRPGSAKDFVAAWALAAGASLPLGVSTSLDLGYRYVGYGDVDLGGRRKASLADLGRHEIRLGLRLGAW